MTTCYHSSKQHCMSGCFVFFWLNTLETQFYLTQHVLPLYSFLSNYAVKWNLTFTFFHLNRHTVIVIHALRLNSLPVPYVITHYSHLVQSENLHDILLWRYYISGQYISKGKLHSLINCDTLWFVDTFRVRFIIVIVIFINNN